MSPPPDRFDPFAGQLFHANAYRPAVSRGRRASSIRRAWTEKARSPSPSRRRSRRSSPAPRRRRKPGAGSTRRRGHATCTRSPVRSKAVSRRRRGCWCWSRASPTPRRPARSPTPRRSSATTPRWRGTAPACCPAPPSPVPSSSHAISLTAFPCTSCPSTSPSCCSAGRWPPRWPSATPAWSSPRSSPRCPPWPSCSTSRSCRTAWSPALPAARRRRPSTSRARSAPLEEALRAYEALEAGLVWVNNPLIDNDALPFGGWKLSGLGRQLGRAGLDAFRQSKMGVIDWPPQAQDWWYPYPRDWFHGTGSSRF